MYNKMTWHLIRTFTFYVIGILNTLLIKPEDVGSWKNYLGYAFMIIAVLDSINLIKIQLNKRKGET